MGSWPNAATLRITNSTLSGNVAGGGGGISLFRSGLQITNSTVSDNTADYGGGIGTGPGFAFMHNTILARNTVHPSGMGPDCWAGVISQGHNLPEVPGGCPTTLLPSDRTGDPGSGALTDHGVPGQGYVPLLPTSPAVDASDPAACPATAPAGRWRVGPCDIGAVEFQATITELVTDV